MSGNVCGTHGLETRQHRFSVLGSPWGRSITHSSISGGRREFVFVVVVRVQTCAVKPVSTLDSGHFPPAKPDWL